MPSGRRFKPARHFPDYGLYHFTLPRLVREGRPEPVLSAEPPFSPDGTPPNDPDSATSIRGRSVLRRPIFGFIER